MNIVQILDSRGKRRVGLVSSEKIILLKKVARTTDLARLALKEGVKLSRPAVGALHQHHRKNDPRVQIGSDAERDIDLARCRGVGCVNDPNRRLASPHVRQRRTHVLRGNDARPQAFVDAGLLERRNHIRTETGAQRLRLRPVAFKGHVRNFRESAASLLARLGPGRRSRFSRSAMIVLDSLNATPFSAHWMNEFF